MLDANPPDDAAVPLQRDSALARPCPGCQRMLGPDVVVCVNCGYDFRTGRRLTAAHERLSKKWHFGVHPVLGLGIFIGVVVLIVAVWVATAVDVARTGSLTILLIVLPVSLVVLLVAAGMCGSRSDVHLTRDKNGEAILRLRHVFCFLRRRTDVIRLADCTKVLIYQEDHVVDCQTPHERDRYSLAVQEARSGRRRLIFEGKHADMRRVLSWLQRVTGLPTDQAREWEHIDG